MALNSSSFCSLKDFWYLFWDEHCFWVQFVRKISAFIFNLLTEKNTIVIERENLFPAKSKIAKNQNQIQTFDILMSLLPTNFVLKHYNLITIFVEWKKNLLKLSFHSQFADSKYILRIPPTVADSPTSQFNSINVSLFVFGFRKLFCISQICLRIPQIRLFWSDFERYSILGVCLWNP